jgi:hypothetical protein
VALLFRYAIKIWVRWALPQVTAPGRVWGIEDFFFLVAYGFDVAHMAFIQKRYDSLSHNRAADINPL